LNFEIEKKEPSPDNGYSIEPLNTNAMNDPLLNPKSLTDDNQYLF